MTIEDKNLEKVLQYAANLRVSHTLAIRYYEQELTFNPSEAVERTKQYIKLISSYDEECYGL